MRIRSTSILILAWVLLSFSTFVDQVNTAGTSPLPLSQIPMAMTQASADDLDDDIKSYSGGRIEAIGSTPDQVWRTLRIQIFDKTLDRPLAPRYELLSVYRF